MNIAIIPARGGSTRIKAKNRRYFHGKPIIAFSIEAAKETELFDLILVSTDDNEIAKIARNYGAEVHDRAPELARNDVGTQEVTRAILLELSAKMREEKVPWALPGESITGVCTIYPTAPMIYGHDISMSMQVLLSGNLAHVYSVGQDGKDAGQFYWSTAQALIDRYPYDGDNTGRQILPANRVCDINIEDDWLRAERMYAELQAQ